MRLAAWLILLLLIPAARSSADGSIEKISISHDGAAPNADSRFPDVSANGRFIVYESAADNLTADFAPLTKQAYLFDREAGTTEYIQPLAGQPAVSNTGLVLFTTGRSIIPALDSNMHSDIYLRIPAGQSTELVSSVPDGRSGNGKSLYPVLSADGRMAAFESLASDLVAGDTNGVSDVFLRDLQSGTTLRVSVTASGAEANGPSHFPAISPDGRYVAYHSYSSNLVPDQIQAQEAVFLYDLEAQTTTLISRAPDGSPAWGRYPRVTADRELLVVFSSRDSRLAGVPGEPESVFLYRQLLAGGPLPRVIDDEPEASAAAQSNGRFTIAVELPPFQGVDPEFKTKLLRRLKRQGLPATKSQQFRMTYQAELRLLSTLPAAAKRRAIRRIRSRSGTMLFKNAAAGRYAVRYRVQVRLRRRTAGRTSWSPVREVLAGE